MLPFLPFELEIGILDGTKPKLALFRSNLELGAVEPLDSSLGYEIVDCISRWLRARSALLPQTEEDNLLCKDLLHKWVAAKDPEFVLDMVGYVCSLEGFLHCAGAEMAPYFARSSDAYIEAATLYAGRAGSKSLKRKVTSDPPTVGPGQGMKKKKQVKKPVNSVMDASKAEMGAKYLDLCLKSTPQACLKFLTTGFSCPEPTSHQVAGAGGKGVMVTVVHKCPLCNRKHTFADCKHADKNK